MNRVSIIKFPAIKMRWEAKLAAIAAMKGIKDYEEWAIGLSDPLTNPHIPPIEPHHIQWVEDWTSAEDLFAGPKSDKELLLEKAIAIREQITEAIAEDDFERASVLQKTLDIIESKYNKL